MKASVTLHYEFGERTCAVEPGKFCMFAQLFIQGGGKCHHPTFGGERLWDDGGWLMRSDACLAHHGSEDK